MIGWIILAIIALLACAVLLACDQPGHRRRRQDSNFDGPDRREDKTTADFFERPVFNSLYDDEYDTVKHKQDSTSKVNRDNT